MTDTWTEIRRVLDARPDVPLETRMEMTSVAMDVLLSNAVQTVGHSNAETVRAVAKALSEPSGYGLSVLERVVQDTVAGIPTTPRQVLLKAAELIRDHGWTQWLMEDAEGRLCIAGAVIRAAGGRWDALVVPSLELLLSRIQREYPWIRHVAEWNDGPYGSRHGALRFLEMTS